ncbi:hypothetical protein JOF56_003612 [Kibdelosporangium banguiense]|uniref:DUF2249 domain-containing protein n=1 Tax=Kibdelosporangium banguiense TaxID=1365924 RepID=A0ABS4TFN1_9PSEU|nr:hypothetical protein [Kibdelosporangium banguiense]MBP2323227.1 hypothetical protein [Kibdelosporangium banguiense]
MSDEDIPAATRLPARAILAELGHRPSSRFRLIHLFDTMVVVDPATLPDRLAKAGFADVDVKTTETRFRFHARKS